MARALRVLATSALGALPSEEAPVGGGVAVLEALLPRLAARADLDVRLLVAGARAEEATGADGVAREALALPELARAGRAAPLAMGARAYARFARAWERALEARLAREDPRGAVVLANDVSEGPPFARLARRGFGLVCLWHVVVGDFLARRYLAAPGVGAVPARAVAAGWRALARAGLARLAPDALALAYGKEEDAARHARAVVPSRPLADALARLYPASGVAERTRVVPWGVVGASDPARRARRAHVLARLGIPAERRVVLSLSRISPEKRLTLLAEALRRLERADPDAADRLALVVAGAPAYLGGARAGRRLAAAAARLRRVPCVLAGHVGGEAKWDLLAAADVFASTSSYEAYGLGLAQALASGTPVVAVPHEGARAILGPDADARDAARAAGVLVPPRASSLARALAELARRDLAPARAAAATWGRAHPFDEAAAAVEEELRRAAR